MESTTWQVVNWIRSGGGDFVLAIGEDFGYGTEVSCELRNDTLKCRLLINGKPYDLDEVHVVWYRRDGSMEPESPGSIEDTELRDSIVRFRRSELRETKWTFYQLLKNKKFLTRPFQREMNKLEALSLAIGADLNVPASLISDSKVKVTEFFREKGTLITKPILNGEFFRVKKESYVIYTEALGENEIAALPDKFFPTLFQEKVEKEYEIRTFYLDGRCYSMAIFSQADEQTSVDFRRYNRTDPNRTVPYQLPGEIERSISKLMKSMELKTGSIDLLKSIEGGYYFLEVNAVGQFGMVSDPCNYYLEKAVADFLIANDYPDGKKGTKVQ